MTQLNASAYWIGYGLLSMATGLLMTWWLLAQVNFLYPVWYSGLAIDQHIARYAPQNRHRQHFERTDRAEHQRLFAALNTAIHTHGQGLAELRYYDPAGRPLGTLLTEPERRHLCDVAELVQRVLPLVGLAAGAWLLWSTVLLWRKRAPPPLRYFVLGSVLTMALLGVVIGVMGPVHLFYAWHEWVFPPDNPWFFYYQESLMTTLLKAPDLFMAIGALWGISAWVLTLCLWGGLRRLAQRPKT